MKHRTLLLALAIGAGSPAAADEIVFPAQPLERTGTAEVIYRLDRPATGRGALVLEWTDAHGRLVDRRREPVLLEDATDIAVTLDFRRVAATANRLEAHLSLDGLGGDGTPDRREGSAEAVFHVPPPRRGWQDYQVIMWQPQTTETFAALKGLGISAGKTYATPDRELFDQLTGPLLANDLPWYIENIANDFYSAYHRWTPDRPKNWRFIEARKLYRADPNDQRAFWRDPSLSDPAWLKTVRERLAAAVQAHGPYRPLFYNLADEPGIAQTAAFWDFDLSEPSLNGMRDWLREEYGDLAALNRQWDSDFANWDEVVPMTTAEAVERSDDNFSAWADFKTWMDVAFARAIRIGTDAVHEADPAALVAIEGAQIPGWGGWDYTRLAHAVDVMEIYDYGENVEIVRSLNPELILLATSGGSGAGEAHVVWRDLLRGSRGVILWDDAYEVVGRDGRVGERGRQAAHWIGKIRDGVGALLIAGERRYDPIAMLYSPPSLRTRWVLEVKPGGQAWSERDVDSEYEDNTIRASSRRFRWALEHMGLQHRMVSPEQVEGGVLQRGGYRLLILPHAIAMSEAEAEQIRRFVAQGGIVVADGEAGLFDAHSRRRPGPLLADLFPAGPGEAVQPGTGRGIRVGTDGLDAREMRELLEPILEAAAIDPQYRLATPEGGPVMDVETHVFRNGEATLLAFQRNPPRLPTAEGTTGAGAAGPIVLTLPRPFFAYDVLRREPLGRVDRLELRLDGVEPTLLSLADAPLPAPAVLAPRRLRLGETGVVEIEKTAGAASATQVVHLAVFDPAGEPVPHYSGNLIFSRGPASHLLPLALDDPAGRWQIRVTDVLSGRSTVAELEVVAP